jgi:hypothetical protein
VQPELVVIVQLETKPRVFLLADGSADEARLLDDLGGRGDLPQEIAEVVGKAMHAMRLRVERYSPGDVA